MAEADTNSAASRSKHRRMSFDGSEEEKAYLVGFRIGDLTAWQVSGTAVMVTSTTTHPEFAALFHQLFTKYGHVYEYPMHEEGKGYKWKLAVRLDNSFQFLLASPSDASEQFSAARLLYASWLAGLVDSDGNIHINEYSGHVRVRVVVANSDTALLRRIISHGLKFGYHFDGPYLLKPKGTVTPYGIRYAKDLWHVSLQRTQEARRLLTELPIRHKEKEEKKALALSVGIKPWKEINPKVSELKQKIKEGVLRFTKQAEEVYRKRRQKPYRKS